MREELFGREAGRTHALDGKACGQRVAGRVGSPDVDMGVDVASLHRRRFGRIYFVRLQRQGPGRPNGTRRE